MYSHITLINENLFRQHSPITGNTDFTEFTPYLSIAQDLYISPLLGESLMNELRTQIRDNNLSEPNSRLILRVAPFLSFMAVYQGLPFHWASIVNKGITIRESENSKGINITDVAQLRLWIRNDADILFRLLTEFLCSNKQQYPLWKPDKDHCDGNNRSQDTYNNGFYFPRR